MTSQKITLKQLLPDFNLGNAAVIEIQGINLDSRTIKTGDLFVALVGAKVDGRQFIAKAIEKSERADTRYWSTLPQDLRIASFNLPSGTYDFSLVADVAGTKRKIGLGKKTLSKDSPHIFINHRTFLPH
jgi:hypothetical protein